MGRQRHREVKQYVNVQPADKGQSQELNPGNLIITSDCLPHTASMWCDMASVLKELAN